MKHTWTAAALTAATVIVTALPVSVALGAEKDDLLDQLRQDIEDQRKVLADQELRLRVLESTLNENGATVTPVVFPVHPLGSGIANGLVNERGIVRAQAGQAPVGEAPPDEEIVRPDIQAGFVRGGVLTPQGTLAIEPAIQYGHTQQNRFVFRGVEVIEALLLGVTNLTDSDRDIVQASVTGRLGLTDRLEAELRVPYVYRKDRNTSIATIGGADVSLTDTVDGMDIGDIDGALHFQMNDGIGNTPLFFVGNLRGRSTTGNGPFDISRDADGVETELASGFGFYGVEPSITAIFSTPPAVLFGNIGYLWNIEDSVNQQISSSTFVGDVDPGDAIRTSFGMGFSINEETSFSLGYSHDFIGETETEINGVTTNSEELQVGQLSFGVQHVLTPAITVDFSLQMGVTDDAPDLQATLRVPIRLGEVF